jgi:hypothetical protein
MDDIRRITSARTRTPAGMMRDLFLLSEGDGLLHDRLGARSIPFSVNGISVFGETFRLHDEGGHDYVVGFAAGPAGDRLVTAWTWLSGFEEWEAAGRPMDGRIRPRDALRYGLAYPADSGLPEVSGFLAAVRGLHAEFCARPGYDEDARAVAVARAEAAMRQLRLREYAASGVPAWLLDEGDLDPRFGP